jgi:hypothetical protein
MEDPSAGISERFLTPTFGGVPSVAVLTTPRGPARPLGWVVCHPFGSQQVNLASLETSLCRALASAGFPSLRYHSRGYGDSQAASNEANLVSHLEDAAEAVRLLSSSVDIGAVGLTGSLFGGCVAALVADELATAPVPSTALVLWEPVVSGRLYMQMLLRFGVMTQLANRTRSRSNAEDPADELRREGVLEVQGFPLTQATFDQVSGVDLRKDLAAFRGTSLVVQISKTGKPRSDLQGLASHLTAIGGTARLDVIEDPNATDFGGHRYKDRGDGTKTDIHGVLSTALVDATLRWCGTELGEAP